MNKEDYLNKQWELVETLKLEYELESFNEILNWTINFGKHKGETYATIFSCYPSYVEFLIKKNMINEKVKNCYLLRKRIEREETFYYHTKYRNGSL